MKKKTVKIMVSALTMSAIFVSGVYAGSTLEQISAYLNKGVTLTWNGVPFYPQEDDGTRVYPITYNGRTYLPVKFVAEKAGLNVGWDGTTQTVSIADENYVAPTVTKGSYTKIGNGEIALLTGDFASLAEKGYIVKEKKATTAYDTHTISLAWASGNSSQKGQVHKLLVQQLGQTLTSSDWNLTSSTKLSDDHYKNIYQYSKNPIEVEIYSNDTEAVLVAKRTDVSGKGTYKKIGNGQIAFMTDDFSQFTEKGYNVEETLALSSTDKHVVKLSSMTSDLLTRRAIHIADMQNNKTQLLAAGVQLVSSTELSNGHYKNVYKYPNSTLVIEVSSSDDAVTFSAYQTVETITNTSIVGYEGCFSSVPKPTLDSTWSEETTMDLKDYTVGTNVAYTLYKTFHASTPSKVDGQFANYQKKLTDNGFTLYDVSSDHYTYIKGDISVTIFAGYDYITVDLASGYQARHM